MSDEKSDNIGTHVRSSHKKAPSSRTNKKYLTESKGVTPKVPKKKAKKPKGCLGAGHVARQKIKDALSLAKDSRQPPDKIVNNVILLLENKKPVGQQITWPPERIKQIADGYEEWVYDSDDNTTIYNYFKKYHGISPQVLTDLRNKSKYLNDMISSMEKFIDERTYELAKKPKHSSKKTVNRASWTDKDGKLRFHEETKLEGYRESTVAMLWKLDKNHEKAKEADEKQPPRTIHFSYEIVDPVEIRRKRLEEEQKNKRKIILDAEKC